jgi:hypothetical protein
LPFLRSFNYVVVALFVVEFLLDDRFGYLIVEFVELLVVAKKQVVEFVELLVVAKKQVVENHLDNGNID